MNKIIFWVVSAFIIIGSTQAFAAKHYYNEQGQLDHENDSLGSEVTYTYWPNGVVKTHTTSGSWGSYEENYDENNQMLSYVSKDSEGTINWGYTNEYDSQGNIIKESSLNPDGSFGATNIYRYDNAGNQVYMEVRNGNGEVESISETTYVSLPSGQKTYTVYKNGQGEISSGDVVNVENGVVTSVDHYSMNTLSGSDTFVYEDGKMVSATTTQWGSTTTYSWEYNPDGSMKSETQATPWSTMISEYGSDGKVSSTTMMYGDSFGSHTEYEYVTRNGRDYILQTNKDENGNVINTVEYDAYTMFNTRSWDPDGTVHYGYGYEEETTDENGNKVVYSYLGDNSSYRKMTYDEEGQMILEEMWYGGFLSNTVEYSYENGIQTEIIRKDSEGNINSSERFEYDDYGNLIKYWMDGRLQEEYEWANPNWKAGAINKAQNANRKLIYTIEEAQKLSKKENNSFKVRYK